MITVKNEESTLAVDWSDGATSRFHSVWLRDNCRCEACGEPSIGRRTLRLSGIDLEVTISAAEALQDGDSEIVRIRWSDDHRGEFDGAWLRDNAYDTESRRKRAYRPELWTDQLREHPPSADYDEVMENDSAFCDFLETIHRHGLCFVEGSPAEPGTGANLARKIGFLQESNYGLVQDLIADRRHRSIGNDFHALKPHTDEPYRASPPGIMLFHCVETDENGLGASTFMDGFEIAETLRADDPEGFDALARYNQGFRRHFDGDIDLICEFPVISVDEFGHVCGVRINDRVASPACIDPESVPVYYRGMKRFLQLAEDDGRMIQKVLRPGDIAAFDNHRILHGRTELRFQGRRWLQWMQVERGDFYSTLRILSDRLGRHRNTLPLLRGEYGSSDCRKEEAEA
ncbi:MAG: DUF971 domain-containing protein [Gammaproteobacteria bacterium]|nr:DUF971 domain-containing protein [Gammaproteobacteria bacterium]